MLNNLNYCRLPEAGGKLRRHRGRRPERHRRLPGIPGPNVKTGTRGQDRRSLLNSDLVGQRSDQGQGPGTTERPTGQGQDSGQQGTDQDHEEET